MNIIGLAVVVVGLIVLGQYNSKIALLLAAIIFLGSMFVNWKSIKPIIEGGN